MVAVEVDEYVCGGGALTHGEALPAGVVALARQVREGVGRRLRACPITGATAGKPMYGNALVGALNNLF